MKKHFAWRLISADGIFVTEPFKNKAEMENAHKQNPDWIPQRVLVYS